MVLGMASIKSMAIIFSTQIYSPQIEIQYRVHGIFVERRTDDER
jgi:hypothetical protein